MWQSTWWRRLAVTVAAFALGLLGASSIAVAQPLTKVHRIGWLGDGSAPSGAAQTNGDFQQGLRDAGYVEGRNVAIDYRYATGDVDRLPQLAAEFVRLPVDVIVTSGEPAALAATRATKTIPIIVTQIGMDPVKAGLVASLARPGGNVTGLSAYVTELAGKRVELMKEARPSIARIGFLLNMGNPVSPPQWDANQASAKALGLSAELFDIRTAQDISGAFAGIAKGRVDALSVGIDALTQANAKMIVDLAAEHGLLTAYPAREFVEFGGLLSYGPSYPDLYYRAAGLIDKIFKGAKPGDLPVEQPTKLELVINLKTAKTLGLEIPPNLLARADEVID